MYVVQTAEMLEEWEIVKTNRWGKQQKRVIGIGKDTFDKEYKVYNSKRDEVNKSRITDKVSRDSRLLRDCLAVKQTPGKPRFFNITYRDEGGSAKPMVVTYEVPLTPNAPKGESAASGDDDDREVSSKELKEQENAAEEQCVRIVAKVLFLLDLQRQRAMRERNAAAAAAGRTISSSGGPGTLSGGGGGGVGGGKDDGEGGGVMGGMMGMMRGSISGGKARATSRALGKPMAFVSEGGGKDS